MKLIRNMTNTKLEINWKVMLPKSMRFNKIIFVLFQCCAMTFIENLSAESVNMDPEEFETYTSGKSVPLESWRSNLLMCDGLQKMSQNLKVLAELKTQQKEILEGAKQLQLDLEKFQSEISDEVQAVMERTTYTIKKRTKEPIGELNFS